MDPSGVVKYKVAIPEDLKLKDIKHTKYLIMKWFKHQTDASDDIKIKRLEDKFGITGYAIFFKIIEKVGKEGWNYALNTKKYPIEFLAKDFKVEKKTFEECLTFMTELDLITLKKDLISIPNMKKYADDYTYKVRRKSRQGQDNVLLEEKRREEIRLEEKRGSSSLKKKPYYRGLEVRKDARGKLWILPKDGGKWLEFAGKEKDIVYK